MLKNNTRLCSSWMRKELDYQKINLMNLRASILIAWKMPEQDFQEHRMKQQKWNLSSLISQIDYTTPMRKVPDLTDLTIKERMNMMPSLMNLTSSNKCEKDWLVLMNTSESCERVSKINKKFLLKTNRI